MRNVLLPLLRLGLGYGSAEDGNLSDYIMLPAKKWEALGNLAREQGVLGIMLDGVERLESTPFGATRELKVNQKLEWIGEVLQIEQRNLQQIAVMNDLATKWRNNGYRVMVMKGQTNATLYPKPGHRNPGDIDCYLFEHYSDGNNIARQEGGIVDESWYKHSVISYKGETFENHQYFVHTREGKRSKQLEKELEEALKVDEDEFKQLTPSTVMPPVQWTAMFLTYHACAHFLTEGLRLKQVLDWAAFLMAHQNDVDWCAFYAFSERYHLKTFSETITSICCDYLGVEISNSNIRKNDAFTEKMLNSILYDDDYIYNEREGGWKEKWYIVKNLFRYRWKYEEIYKDSVWKQLWYYTTGYLFKTEKT
jgi:hypothetical protein